MRVPCQGLCDPQDPVCAAAYFWSVGHANACYLKPLEAIVDVYLVINVQMRRALVEKEDSWLSIECSREHHSLFLSARQRAAHVSDQGIVGHRHRHDLFMNPGPRTRSSVPDQ